MSIMTLEQLLIKEPDSTILDIYNELESRVVPATGYAHAYCRKVNKLINAGELCTVQDKYRNVYLPTLSKMIFKEMSRRYANYCRNCKTIEDTSAGDDTMVCNWCEEEFDASELYATDMGMLCDGCIAAIRSRGEQITVFY